MFFWHSRTDRTATQETNSRQIKTSGVQETTIDRHLAVRNQVGGFGELLVGMEEKV